MLLEVSGNGKSKMEAANFEYIVYKLADYTYRRSSNGYPHNSDVAQLAKHIVHTANVVGSNRKL